MQKLKSLRGAVGLYGRVSAGGIVEVDDALAKKMLATKRFVSATEADITAAQKAQKAAMAVQVTGAAPGFAPMPVPPKPADRLQALIQRGEISVEDAKRLVNLQIEVSPDEIKAMVKREMDQMATEILDLQGGLEGRQDELDGRQAALDAREADLEAATVALSAREAALAATAEDLDAREAALQAAPPVDVAPEADAPAPAKASADKKTAK